MKLRENRRATAEATAPAERPRGEHPVDQLFGRLSLDRPVDETVDQMRGPRPQRQKKKSAVHDR
jgi:hypothetical protein